MTRIASRAPELDIFGQRLIEREAGCWIITAEGRQLLQTLEQLDRDGARGRAEPKTGQRPEGERTPLVTAPPRAIARRNRLRRKRLSPRKGRLA
jgi:hypothetical protein